MLYWVESFDKVTKLPFENDYRRWVKALDAGELKAIREELNRVFNSSQIETCRLDSRRRLARHCLSTDLREAGSTESGDGRAHLWTAGLQGRDGSD